MNYLVYQRTELFESKYVFGIFQNPAHPRLSVYSGEYTNALLFVVGN